MATTQGDAGRHARGGRMRTALSLSLAAAVVLGTATTGVVAQVPEGEPVLRDRVDSLAASGRLQEAAWRARADADTARGDRLLRELEEILRAPPVRATPQEVDQQGVSYTFRLLHGRGIASIFKVDSSDIFCRACGADREVASYRLDRLLGLDLTPMTVPTNIVSDRGDTLSGSTMYFIHGASLPGDAGARKPDALRFFDAAIGNSDRHASNWLVLGDGRVVAIDHNRAFQYGRPSNPKTCWETEIDSIARPRDLAAALERYRTLPEDSFRVALEGLDPDLVRRFLDMRPRVVGRIDQRIRRPGRTPPHDDCNPDR